MNRKRQIIALLTFVAFAGCSDEQNAAPYAVVFAETIVEVGRQDVSVTVGVGRGRAVVTVPAASVSQPARMRVRVVGQLAKRGRTPAGDVAVEITGEALVFTGAARLRQAVLPAAPMRGYVLVGNQGKAEGFAVRRAAVLVGAVPPNDEDWEADVTETGVWGFAHAEDQAVVDGGADTAAAQVGCDYFPGLVTSCLGTTTEAQRLAASNACKKVREVFEPIRAKGALNPRVEPIFDACVANTTKTELCNFITNKGGEIDSSNLAEACLSIAALEASPPSYKDTAALQACSAGGYNDELLVCTMILRGGALVCEQGAKACGEADPNVASSDDVCYLSGLFLDEKLPQFEACATLPCAEQKQCYDTFWQSNGGQ